MRNKSLVGWNFTSKMEGIVVFANLIDEMTFNYTYDSYKAPALNIISLLDEAHETVLDIENGMIKEEGMRSGERGDGYLFHRKTKSVIINS